MLFVLCIFKATFKNLIKNGSSKLRTWQYLLFSSFIDWYDLIKIKSFRNFLSLRSSFGADQKILKTGTFCSLFRIVEMVTCLNGKIVPSAFNDAVDSALNRELLYFNIETSMLNQELVCFHTHNRAPAGVWSDMLIVKHF